jgi:8-oxo-dGTP pyrophosphatase MutT (NUDIX family)
MNAAIYTSLDLPKRLAADLLRAPLTEWRHTFAPELSYGRHTGPARSDARIAAVAIVLCWDRHEWSLPLTVRCATLTHHGGQVSLPGGLLEVGETPREAAQRELEEELGVRLELKWLGDLSPLFVFASNALVTPCLAAIDHWPEWQQSESEVECVLKLTLQELLDAKLGPPLEIERGPIRFLAPQLLVEGRSAWGATAVMLAELRGRLQRITKADRSSIANR